MRHSIFIVFILSIASITAFNAKAQADNERLEAKADRAFQAKEWASADALYLLLCQKEPGNFLPYARIMAACHMRDDKPRVTDAMKTAMQNGIKLPQLLSQLKSDLYSTGNAAAYPQILKESAQDLPFLRRAIQSRLLDYYLFRCDPANTIEYASALLKGAPDNTNFLNAIGKAYLDEGQIKKAAEAFAETLDKDPGNYDALVALGSCLGLPEGRVYLAKAYAIKPTPYLQTILKLNK